MSYNESFFPNNLKFNWNEDNLGPILIPKMQVKQLKLITEIIPL